MAGRGSQRLGGPARLVRAWFGAGSFYDRHHRRLLPALAPLVLAIALLSASTAAAAEKKFNFETPKIEGTNVYGPGLGKYEHEIEPYIAEGLEQASTVARSVTVKVG